MRIIVLGGGTAGFMAAAHISHFFPEEDLIHIYDSSIPSIGVGEGTLPAFKTWLDAVTNLTFQELEKVCQATQKVGINFEGWGTTNEEFNHNFVGDRHAYHLSAANLPAILEPYIHATHIEKYVSQLQSSGKQVDIRFGDHTHLQGDIVFDATGFPKTLGKNQIQLMNIPTNAALLWRRQINEHKSVTRAVARPHGWVFVIPLTTSTSYGYIFNREISSEDEVREDFVRFLEIEGVKKEVHPRLLHFPSFVQRRFFDGTIFRIGNAASFLEPLEATAIGLTLEELRLASLWLGDGLLGVRGQEKWDPDILEMINVHLIRTVQAVALFVSWHYAYGSIYDTPFWRYAKTVYKKSLQKHIKSGLPEDFQKFLQAGALILPSQLRQIRERQFYEQNIKPQLAFESALGGFGIPSFAQIGYGIGAYPTPTSEVVK